MADPAKVASPLITAAELHPHLGDPAWAVFDCRFNIKEPESGPAGYLAGHIPGAAYAHLDQLSAPIIKGTTGRHPLPDPATAAATFADWGIGNDTSVVVYDDTSGSIAARMWWMLRWLGHDAVQMLDGGWKAWVDAGYPTRNGPERRRPSRFTPRVRPEMVADTAMVNRARTDRQWLVADARARDRYRGENETIDPVAGHIPGAVSVPWNENIDASGRFLPAAELARKLRSVVGAVPPSHVVCYCGSGVTAAHDALAMAVAGLGDVRLYPGSWSEWITDPARPVARGE